MNARHYNRSVKAHKSMVEEHYDNYTGNSLYNGFRWKIMVGD